MMRPIMRLAVICTLLCVPTFHAFVHHRRTVSSCHIRRASSAYDLRLRLSANEESIVEQCYTAWNERKMDDAAACFANNFVYDDGQYLGTISKKPDLERLFQRGAKALPPNAAMVVDHIAKCKRTGNIGTQWHVEKDDGSTVPFTRGCSFYTVDKESGLLKTGFRVSEMIVKPSKQFSDSLVSSASKMMQATERLGWMGTAKAKIDEPAVETASIIEKYFEAWNRRDMKAALDCFSDDAVYETEDPVFVDAFRGKEALRDHLMRNVEVLPSACKIILDDLAIDLTNGKFGVKWHLEANGVSIPNLRGCSMYTEDMESGLLQSGFDVTEAPVKLPGVAQDVLATPFGKLLF